MWDEIVGVDRVGGSGAINGHPLRSYYPGSKIVLIVNMVQSVINCEYGGVSVFRVLWQSRLWPMEG